jgi:hypothetical protein
MAERCPAARSFQNIPSRMKNPISIRNVVLMIATVRNTSLADIGVITASRFAKPLR